MDGCSLIDSCGAQAVPLGPATNVRMVDDTTFSGASARPTSDAQAIEMDRQRAELEADKLKLQMELQNK